MAPFAANMAAVLTLHGLAVRVVLLSPAPPFATALSPAAGEKLVVLASSGLAALAEAHAELPATVAAVGEHDKVRSHPPHRHRPCNAMF